MVLPSCRNSRSMQYLATLVVALSIASCGMYNSWSSPSLINLGSENSPIGHPITDKEGSWIASSFLLGAIPSCFVTIFIVDKFERHTLLLASAIPLFIPWIVCAFTKSIIAIIIVRCLAGMGASVAMTIVPIYIGEIADKDIRGKLGTAFNILKLSGSLFVLSVGPFISYRALTLSCSVAPLIFAGSFYFMPESPYFLVKSQKPEKAKRNLSTLNRKNITEKELCDKLDEITATVECDMQNKSSIKEFLIKPEYRRSLLILFVMKTLQQFSGMNAIDAYTQTIVKLSHSGISEELSSILCGFIQIPAVLSAAALVDKMGRKPLLMISSFGCAFALICEGTYFYLLDVVKTDLTNYSWIPTTALILYLIMNPIGLFTLPYVLLGELFPTNIKGIAVSIATCYGGLLGFLVIKTFSPISNAWGMHTMFWMYAGCCIVGSSITFLLLPETKGKSFIQIQAELNKKSPAMPS